MFGIRWPWSDRLRPPDVITPFSPYYSGDYWRGAKLTQIPKDLVARWNFRTLCTHLGYDYEEELERMMMEHTTEARPISAEHVVDNPSREPVNHPQHYTWHPTIECIEVTQHFNFNLGNVIKYVWRAGAPVPKEDRVQDLKKAQKYIEFELGRLSG